MKRLFNACFRTPEGDSINIPILAESREQASRTASTVYVPEGCTFWPEHSDVDYEDVTGLK